MAWSYVCTSDTRDECFDRLLFGDSKPKAVQPGNTLFLTDLDEGMTFGPFRAESGVGRFEPRAWNGRFQHQVRVSWGTLYVMERHLLPKMGERGFDGREELGEDVTTQIVKMLKNEGREWAPEAQPNGGKARLIQQIREHEARIHKLAHRLEEARMPGSGHPANRVVKVDQLKGEFYHAMMEFVYAVRRYDRATGDFGLSTNR